MRQNGGGEGGDRDTQKNERQKEKRECGEGGGSDRTNV